jgi:predicted acylesterase/phospholipase RssA
VFLGQLPLVDVVVSGAGSLGPAEAGALAILRRHVTIARIGGASAGAINAVAEAAGIEDVTVHDLRRTLGSWLASSGQSLPMIGRILNQTSAKATQIYARLQLAPVALALESHGDNLKAVSDAAQLSVAAAGAASDVERRDIESR